jgi:hypothetical protein
MTNEMIKSAEYATYFSLDILIKSLHYWKRRCEMAEKFIDTQGKDDFAVWQSIIKEAGDE